MRVIARLARLIGSLYRLVNRVLASGEPLVLLIARCVVAKQFLVAGLLKLTNWESTVYLFEYEYHVPLLDSKLAAYLGMSGEITGAFLLVLGLFNRIPALLLFIVNGIALWSYPFLWTDNGMVGFMQHVYWGLLLAILMTIGVGKWSAEGLYQWRRLRKK